MHANHPEMAKKWEKKEKMKKETKVKSLIKKMVREVMDEGKLVESGIMYHAGVKKYGKEGMTKIQQAAGKGKGHAEIGKIKDKYDKTKKEEKLSEEIQPSKAIKKVLYMADEGYGKLGGRIVDGMSANLFKAVYNKATDKNKEHMNKMNEKQLYVFLTKLWKLKVKI